MRLVKLFTLYGYTIFFPFPLHPVLSQRLYEDISYPFIGLFWSAAARQTYLPKDSVPTKNVRRLPLNCRESQSLNRFVAAMITIALNKRHSYDCHPYNRRLYDRRFYDRRLYHILRCNERPS